MKKHYTLRAVALAGVCMAPMAVAAQDLQVGGAAAAASDTGNYDNEVSVGGRWQSSTQPFFGRYTGLVKKGFSGTADFTFSGRDAPDSGKTGYYEITGSDLTYGVDGLIGPESSLSAKAGNQGLWGVTAGFESISYVGNTIKSPYYSTGAISPGLRAYGGASSMTNNTGAYTGITKAGSATTYSAQGFANGLLTEGTGTRRDIATASAKFRQDGWTVSSDLRHEHKEGTLEQSLYLGVNAAISLPIDYDTNRFDAKLDYASKPLQAQFVYTFSKFDNNNDAFIAPDVLSAASATSATASGATPTGANVALYQVNGVYSQAPSNSAHYFTGTVGYNLNSKTRLTGNFRYGLEMQDDALGSAGYGASLSANPNLALLAVNPSSLNGLARVYQGGVQALSRVTRDLELKANYSVDGRDVDTSSYSIAGMTHAVEAGNFTSVSGVSVPQGWFKQKAGVEGTYRLLENTKLTVGYTLNEADRSNAQVGRNIENTGLVKLATSLPTIGVNGSVSYSHSDRSASATHVDLPWQYFDGSSTAGYPSLTYYQAARVQDMIKARADYMPGEQVVVGVNGRLTNNSYSYPAGIVGNSRDYNASVGPDITYSPTKNLSANFFYNYEEVYYGNRGAGAAASVNNGYGWSASSTDSIHTVGLSTTWKATERLKFNAGYTYSYGDLSYSLFDGVSNISCTACAATSAAYSNVQAPPGIGSTMHSLQVSASYALAPNIDLWGGYEYEMFKDNDWAYTAWSAVTQTSSTGYTVTSGSSQPVDHANVVMTKVRVKF